ncbi:MAG: hypothetical protein RMM17_09035 [Acidobacteriota bacterium]|nr:hypothetical protein [Blastocatellia bacterium]MDW8412811.1 hypothetical protein [Acidobacteriota bacterium]
MIVVMQQRATEEEISQVIEKLLKLGFDPYRSTGASLSIIAGVGNCFVDVREIEMMAGVRKVIRVSTPYKLASREIHPTDTTFAIGNGEFKIGAGYFSVFAGPAAIESEVELEALCDLVKNFGTGVLRSRATLQLEDGRIVGLGKDSWKLLRKYADRFQLYAASEVNYPEELSQAAEYLDVIEISASHNHEFLRQIGMLGKPTLLVRAPETTIEQTLISAEQILSAGNDRVIICDRAVRTVQGGSTIDIDSILKLKKISHLPLALDASAAANRKDRVAAYAAAALVAGVDVLLIELYSESGTGEAARALAAEDFAVLITQLKGIAKILGRQNICM